MGVLVSFNSQATETTVLKSELYVLKPDAGKVTFLATGHPSALKIHGEGTGPEGNLRISANAIFGILKFPVTSLSTGIDMRDHHMKEKYLETAKFPTAELRIENLQLPPGSINELKNVSFTGKLNLKGVEKSVTGNFSTSGTSSEPKFEADFHATLSDFEIQIPSYMGITVAEDVSVHVSGLAQKRAVQ